MIETPRRGGGSPQTGTGDYFLSLRVHKNIQGAVVLELAPSVLPEDRYGRGNVFKNAQRSAISPGGLLSIRPTLKFNPLTLLSVSKSSTTTATMQFTRTFATLLTFGQ